MSGLAVNKNYERYNLWQDKGIKGIAYLAPHVREAFTRCEELNKVIIQFIGNMTSINGTDLDVLYDRQPEVLKTVIYDKDVYNRLLTMLGGGQ